jgi:hypothetical protein
VNPEEVEALFGNRAGRIYPITWPWNLPANPSEVWRDCAALEAAGIAEKGWRFFFREFRRDGWPLCPRCGEDELGSRLVADLAELDFWGRLPWKPSDVEKGRVWLDRYVAAGLICNRCPWWFFLEPAEQDYKDMGFHVCPYCRRATGSGDVLLPFASGRNWLVPDLIAHYISVHHYLPPPEFVEDVAGATLAHIEHPFIVDVRLAATKVGYLEGDFPKGDFPYRLHGILAGLILQAHSRGYRRQTRGVETK